MPSETIATIVRRLLNTGLRGLTLVAKFLLLFVLAKLLAPEEVALYGLFAATLSYSLLAVGFDFYAYAGRELIAADRREWASLIRDQSVFYGFAYLFLLPAALPVFFFGLLPWKLAVWLFPLLLVEHIAQELNRLLIAMGNPLTATAVLFIRSGLWAIAAAIAMAVFPGLRSLEFVLALWLLGAIAACVPAFGRLWMLDKSGLSRAVDWKWIRRGIRLAVPFIVATLSLRLIYTADRYWIEAVGGTDILAAYVLYIGISNAVIAFLDASVTAFLYPGLVAAASRGDVVGFRNRFHRFLRQTVVATTLLCAGGLAASHLIVKLIDRRVYSENLDLAYWVIAAAALYALSMIPHYGLYARRHDRPILISHLLALTAFAGVGLLLVPLLGPRAIPGAMIASSAALLIYKTYAYLSGTPVSLQNDETAGRALQTAVRTTEIGSDGRTGLVSAKA